MSTGDYYIIGMICVLLGGAGLYGLFAMFSRNNKGAWDKTSELVGKLRGKKYTYRDYHENARKFLLRNPQGTAYWPCPLASGAHNLVSNNRGTHWRSCGVQTTKGKDLFFTIEINQRNDGSEFSSPEILFEFHPDASNKIRTAEPEIRQLADGKAEHHKAADLATTLGSESLSEVLPSSNTQNKKHCLQLGDWSVTAAQSETLEAYVDSDFARWLEKMHGFQAVHLTAENLTLVITGQEFEPVLLELFPKLAQAGNAAAEFLPKGYWS